MEVIYYLLIQEMIFWDLISNFEVNTSIGIRNAFMDNYEEITNGDSKFYNILVNEPQITSEIVRLYLFLPAREGRQQRTKKVMKN